MKGRQEESEDVHVKFIYSINAKLLHRQICSINQRTFVKLLKPTINNRNIRYSVAFMLSPHFRNYKFRLNCEFRLCEHFSYL